MWSGYNRMKLSDRILGRIVVELKAAIPESVLNFCNQQRIPLREVERVDACTIRFRVNEQDWDAFQKLAASCQAEWLVLNRRGGSRDRRLLYRRRALLISLLAGALLLVWSNLHIWRIEVEGCRNLTKSEVLRALEDCGVKEGVWWPGLSTDTIRSEMQLMIPDLAWMTVNVSGSRAVVSVVERIEKPEIYHEREAADIVATKDGIINDITVLNGRPLVSRGGAVIKGETLVTGSVDSLSNPTRYVRAEAGVNADTWYEWTAVEPEAVCFKGNIMHTKNRFAVVFGKKRVNIYSGSRKALDGYDKIVHEYRMGVEGLFALPIRVIREEYYLYTQLETPTRDPTDRRARLEQMFSEQIEGSILQVQTRSFTKDNVFYTNLRAHCLENIAKTAERQLP